MIEKLKELEAQATPSGWSLEDLGGKYYGTIVKLGNNRITVWGGRKCQPSVRELENEDPSQYGGYDEMLREIMCDGHYEDVGDYSDALLIVALRNLGPELIALWEAVGEDIKDENGDPCECPRPVCWAYQDLNAKAEEVFGYLFGGDK